MMTAHRVLLIDLVSRGQIDSVRRLIPHCNVDEKTYSGHCAVMACVTGNEFEMLEMLVTANANVDVKDLLGRSALSRAKELEHNEIAQLIEETLAKKAKSSLKQQQPQSASPLSKQCLLSPKSEKPTEDSEKPLKNQSPTSPTIRLR